MLRVASSNRPREQAAHRSIEFLTSRERQVLEALAEGSTARSPAPGDGETTAEKLHITYETECIQAVNTLSSAGRGTRI